MPIHDHQCLTCNHVFDALVKWDDPAPPCTECGNECKRVYLKAPKLNYLAMGAQKNVSPEFQQKFDKMHKDRAVKEEKTMKEHGDYGRGAGG